MYWFLLFSLFYFFPLVKKEKNKLREWTGKSVDTVKYITVDIIILYDIMFVFWAQDHEFKSHIENQDYVNNFERILPPFGQTFFFFSGTEREIIFTL